MTPNFGFEFEASDGADLCDEFLHLDPDSGMVVCMVRDGQTFRPAMAWEEISANLWRISGQTQHMSAHEAAAARVAVGLDCEAGIEQFVNRYECAYGAPSMA